MRKLVIFSKFGPGPETITHGKTGLLCDPYNPTDIANQIKWVFNHPEKSKDIANAGRAFILEHYNLDRILQENESFYESLIEFNQRY